MTCEEWEEAVCGPELKVQGELAQHLTSCANCQATLKVLQLAAPSQPSEVRPSRKFKRSIGVGLVAVAAMFVAVVVLDGWQTEPSMQEEGPLEFGYLVSELFVEPQQLSETYDELSLYEVPWSEEEVP